MPSMASDLKRSKQPTYRIVLMGDPYCGKTSLIARYCRGRYDPSYLQTIGSDYQKRQITIEQVPVTAFIYDTAGQEDMKTVIKSVYRNAHGVMLVFDLTRYNTLKNIPAWIDLIKANTEPNHPEMVLVGNKCDLPDDERKGYCPREMALNIAQDHSINYFNISAKTSENVTTAFEDIIRKIHDHHRHEWAAFPTESFRLREHKKEDTGCCNQT